MSEPLRGNIIWMAFQLGWRNIWRNPRRTAVILLAVTIGIWSMLFLSALMRGIAEDMVRNGIATLTGHIQVHHKGYLLDPVVENSMLEPTQVKRVLETRLPPGTLWAPRVRVNAIASNAWYSEGVTLVAIDPEKEARVSFIGGSISAGEYLKSSDPYGILVGKALLDKFQTKLGRKLILMSQDKGKEIASRAFIIKGVFRTEMEAPERQFVFISLPAAREFLKLNEDISEFCVILPHPSMVAQSAETLRSTLPPAEYEIHAWEDLLPLVRGYLKMYDFLVLLWYLVAFAAMGFGIVNTILMAVLERIREFGLLRALGMKPLWIVKEVLAESFFLLSIGMGLGNILGLLSVSAFSHVGINISALATGAEVVGMPRIIYPVILFRDAALANLVVFFLGLLVSFYPAVKAAHFTPIEAMAQT